MARIANRAGSLGVGVMVAGPVRPADCGASLHPLAGLSTPPTSVFLSRRALAAAREPTEPRPFSVGW